MAQQPYAPSSQIRRPSMGLVLRITGLGLEVLDMHLAAPIPEQ